MSDTGLTIWHSKMGRTWVPFLMFSQRSFLRFLPYRVAFLISRWNRIACWLYGGHDTILYDMRIDPEPDGSYHYPTCCAVVGRDTFVANDNFYWATSEGTTGVNMVTLTDGTAYRRRHEAKSS